MAAPVLAQSTDKLPKISFTENEMIIRFYPEVLSGFPDSLFKAYGIETPEVIAAAKNRDWDVFVKMGWVVKDKGKKGMELRKRLEPVADFSSEKSSGWFWGEMFMSDRQPGVAVMDGSIGYNQIRKQTFKQLSDSIIRFELPGYENASQVYISGSFNNWSTKAVPMQRSGTHWITEIGLPPGKHLYKFIVDGKWIYDTGNELKEEDGYNDYNSVLYMCNHVFNFRTAEGARKVYLAGNFNDWNPKEIRMNKVTEHHFELPVYIVNGTYQYKYVADGDWYEDPATERKVSDGNGGNNSILEIGEPVHFSLKGYSDAHSVNVAGDFNNWNPEELSMTKSEGGWELDYVIAPGNYQYKFIVDGKWVQDPENSLQVDDFNGGFNSLLIFEPNYTFILKQFPDAKSVILTGTFNNWDEKNYKMKRENGEWTFHLFLKPGKYKYKFIVDGNWILDPGNSLWEENEYDTGNSVIWFNPALPQ